MDGAKCWAVLENNLLEAVKATLDVPLEDNNPNHTVRASVQFYYHQKKKQ